MDDARRRSRRAATYSVVPYEGPNSTHRRPVYIECRENSMVLQPEGVELTPADFVGMLGPGNPLASALRAACASITPGKRPRASRMQSPIRCCSCARRHQDLLRGSQRARLLGFGVRL